MKTTFFLVCNQSGLVRAVKTRKPAIAANEVCVKATIHIDDSAFAPAPTPEVEVTIPFAEKRAPEVVVSVQDGAQ